MCIRDRYGAPNGSLQPRLSPEAEAIALPPMQKSKRLLSPLLCYSPKFSFHLLLITTEKDKYKEAPQTAVWKENKIQSLRQYELHQVRGYNLSPFPGTPLSLREQRYTKKGKNIILVQYLSLIHISSRHGRTLPVYRTVCLRRLPVVKGLNLKCMLFCLHRLMEQAFS